MIFKKVQPESLGLICFVWPCISGSARVGSQNRGPFCRRDSHFDSSSSRVLLLTARPGGQEGAVEVTLTGDQSEGCGCSNTQEKTNLLQDNSDEKADSMDQVWKQRGCGSTDQTVLLEMRPCVSLQQRSQQVLQVPSVCSALQATVPKMAQCVFGNLGCQRQPLFGASLWKRSKAKEILQFNTRASLQQKHYIQILVLPLNRCVTEQFTYFLSITSFISAKET